MESSCFRYIFHEMPLVRSCFMRYNQTVSIRTDER